MGSVRASIPDVAFVRFDSIFSGAIGGTRSATIPGDGVAPDSECTSAAQLFQSCRPVMIQEPGLIPARRDQPWPVLPNAFGVDTCRSNRVFGCLEARLALRWRAREQRHHARPTDSQSVPGPRPSADVSSSPSEMSVPRL